MYVRHLDHLLANHFTKYREILILLGGRQVGKTTLLQRLFPKAQYLSVDNDAVKYRLERYDAPVYQQLLNSRAQQVVIDEIPRLTDPGRAAKIFYDQLPKYRFIITGSSAFTIKNKMSDSLAGRKIDYHLYPLSLSEYLVQSGLEETFSFSFFEKILKPEKLTEIIRPYDHEFLLEHLLIYGSYPAMLSHPNDSAYLVNLVDSVVFKDLLDLSLLENKSAALSLLKLLAYQIGSLVNFAELSSRLGINAKTVKRYLELFEQSFIIFTLKPFSSNKRNEIGKMPKVYFYDIGLRNALINNFSPLKDRNDSGQLFENFIISEILKANYYGDFGYNLNYWRTKSGSEVDLILNKTNCQTIAVEIKSTNRRINQAFTNHYPKAHLTVLSKENFWV